MPNENNGWAWAAKYLIGLVATIVIGIAIPTLATNIIANDKESRMRDECIDDKYQKKCDDQQRINEAIVVSLAEIRTDLKYIKEKVK